MTMERAAPYSWLHKVAHAKGNEVADRYPPLGAPPPLLRAGGPQLLAPVAFARGRQSAANSCHSLGRRRGPLRGWGMSQERALPSPREARFSGAWAGERPQ